MKRKILVLRGETIRTLTAELARARGGQVDESFVYSCATVIRSCYVESCAPSGWTVCPMDPAP